MVFDHIVEHYGKLSEIRTERINQCITRLPILLKVFVYTSSLIVIFFFVIMPFNNQHYAYMSAFGVSFIVAVVYHLIEDLDNPFSGFWNLTAKPYQRAIRHIEDDY